MLANPLQQQLYRPACRIGDQSFQSIATNFDARMVAAGEDHLPDGQGGGAYRGVALESKYPGLWLRVQVPA